MRRLLPRFAACDTTLPGVPLYSVALAQLEEQSGLKPARAPLEEQSGLKPAQAPMSPLQVPLTLSQHLHGYACT